MKYVTVFILISMSCILSAQTVEYSDNAESYLNSIGLNNRTTVNSGFSDSDDLPDSFMNSWSTTPDYTYVRSEKNTSSSLIVNRLESMFGDEYITDYDETQGKIIKRLDNFSRGAFHNYPAEKDTKRVENDFIEAANKLLESIPEIKDYVMFHGLAIEKSGSLTKEDKTIRVTEIRVYFRRIMDGAVLSDGPIPVKMVFDASSRVIKKMEVNWVDYESVPNTNYFERFESGSTISGIKYSLHNGKTGVGVYGNEKFDSIYVYSVEKIWKKKVCEDGELLIPALRFFIKVRSESGIKSIPEYFDAGIKEVVVKPVYDLMGSPFCR